MDRIFPEVLAHDGTRPELDAAFRVVDQLAFLEAVDFGRTDVEAGFRIARSAHVRVDRDERFLVELELVQADALVPAEGVRCIGLRRVWPCPASRNRGGE